MFETRNMSNRIYGYYCVHPELIEECQAVSDRKRRLDRLTELNAPAVILENEERMYRNLIKKHSDISCFRQYITQLRDENKLFLINRNYKTVFEDIGFDITEAYGIYADKYNGDYLSPLLDMTDNAVISFLNYTQSKFDSYAEKYRDVLNETRSVLIKRAEIFVKNKMWPDNALNEIDVLKNAEIIIDDGFDTSIQGSLGYYNRGLNKIVLSAWGFAGEDALTLFHECIHALAGYGEGTLHACSGLERLVMFFGDDEPVDPNTEKNDEPNPFEIINEAFVNYYAIKMLTTKPGPELQNELKHYYYILSVIQLTGKQELPKNILENAYFSPDIKDIEILADTIKANFDVDTLFSDIAKIRNNEREQLPKFEPNKEGSYSEWLEKHKYVNNESFFSHMLHNSPYGRAKRDKLFEKLFGNTNE